MMVDQSCHECFVYFALRSLCIYHRIWAGLPVKAFNN